MLHLLYLCPLLSLAPFFLFVLLSYRNTLFIFIKLITHCDVTFVTCQPYSSQDPELRSIYARTYCATALGRQAVPYIQFGILLLFESPAIYYLFQ